ncbi:MAG: hypothetical protein E7472_03775 [Ruminococcaceae bacterium]|nr:hypothetical protein [Oscillospiraceae bacterium]
MITREMIIEELRNRGYDAQENDIYKNGDVKLEAIIIKTEERITPTLYVESIIANAATVKEAADIAEQIYQQHKTTTIDVNQLTNPDFIREHVRVGIEKASEHTNALFRPCEHYDGLIQYLYMTAKTSDKDSWSVRISPELAATANLDIDKLWEIAIERTNADVTIASMAKIMEDIIGMEFDETDDTMFPQLFPMYVITNSAKIKGASAILNHKRLADFAAEHHVKKLIILPSSIHECILIPAFEEEIHIEDLDEMVRSVNAEQVLPEERLFDRALVLNFDEEGFDEITIRN